MPSNRVRIVLVQPGPGVANSYGEIEFQAIQHHRGAVRIDQSGRRRYELPAVGVTRVGPGWLLQDLDDRGRVFAVEAAVRIDTRGRRIAIQVST